MSNSPSTINLSGASGHADPILIGDTYSHSITFNDSAGAPIDKGSPLTWKSEVRNKVGTLVATFTVVVGGASDNVVTISLTSTETEALSEGTDYEWDLQETDPTPTPDQVITRVKGTVKIAATVTQ